MSEASLIYCRGLAEVSDSETQRALGRIEGTQSQILKKLEELTNGFGDHKNEDQKNFSSVRRLVFDQKDEILANIKDGNADREIHLNEQDTKLDALKQDADRAKGAGWVILGILGGIATFIGGSVIAVIAGIIKIRWGAP